MSTLPVLADDGQQLETKALTLSERAAAIQITNQPTYDGAVEFLKGVKDLRGEAEAHHRPVIDAAHKAHKAALEALKRIDGPLESAERAVKAKIGTWDMEQERIRRAEEDRLRREQELAREAELEKQLETAEQEGATQEEVLAMIEQTAFQAAAPPVVAPPTFQRAAGIQTRKQLKVRVTDEAALKTFAGGNRAYHNLLTVNTVALNALLRAQGAAMQIPGVQVYEEATVGVRR